MRAVARPAAYSAHRLCPKRTRDSASPPEAFAHHQKLISQQHNIKNEFVRPRLGRHGPLPATLDGPRTILRLVCLLSHINIIKTNAVRAPRRPLCVSPEPRRARPGLPSALDRHEAQVKQKKLIALRLLRERATSPPVFPLWAILHLSLIHI